MHYRAGADIGAAARATIHHPGPRSMSPHVLPFARRVMLAVAVAALLTACGDDPNAPEALSASFTASITGGVTRSLAGPALFTADLPNSDIGTAFLLAHAGAPGEARRVVYFHRWSAAPLTPGTYAVVLGDEEDPPTDFRAGIGLDVDTSAEQSCFGETGTVRITVATAERVAGTVSFTGTCIPPTAPEPRTPFSVTVTFDAEPGTFGAIPPAQP
jgi:hypothetical protein